MWIDGYDRLCLFIKIYMEVRNWAPIGALSYRRSIIDHIFLLLSLSCILSLSCTMSSPHFKMSHETIPQVARSTIQPTQAVQGTSSPLASADTVKLSISTRILTDLQNAAAESPVPSIQRVAALALLIVEKIQVCCSSRYVLCFHAF